MSLNSHTEKNGNVLRQSPERPRNILTIIKNLLPVLVLSALLPIIYGLFLYPPSLKYFSYAGQEGELRVWFDPADTIVSVGNEAELVVYAEYDGEGKLPSLKIKFTPDPEITTDRSEIVSYESFNGKVSLGKVKVKSLTAGQYRLSIQDSNVEIIGSKGSVKVITAPANLIVR